MDPVRSAEALLGYRDARVAVPAAEWLASGLAPRDEAEAYAVQDAMAALMEARGARRIGYKIGATNQAARDMLGVGGPLYGLLWAEQTVEPASAGGAVDVPFVASLHKVAEAEVALRMARDVQVGDLAGDLAGGGGGSGGGGGGGPVDAAAIRAATAEVIPVVEIAGTSLDPWLAAGGTTLIADNGLHALWVRGQGRADWDGFDPLELPVTISRTMGDAHVGKGGAVDGGAFGAAAWLANKLAEHGKMLKAGDYVSTGSATAPVPVVAGDRLGCDFGALGQVTVGIGA